MSFTIRMRCLLFLFAVCHPGCGSDPNPAVTGEDRIFLKPPIKLLVGTVTTDTLVLSWTAPSLQSPFVTGYAVYSTTNTNEGFQLSGRTAATNFTISNLQSRRKYYLMVKAYETTNSLSAASEIISATMGNKRPAAPAAISFGARTVSSVQVIWPAAVDPDGAVTNYIVYFSLTPSSGYVVAGRTAETNFTVTGLLGARKYYFMLRSVDTDGDQSNPSGERWTNTVNTPPGAPTGTFATGATSMSLRVAWRPSTDSDGTVTNYRVYSATTSGGPYTFQRNSTATNVTISGLSAKTTYYFVVRAIDNLADASPDSTQAVGTTLSQPPSAPANLQCSAVATNGFTLSWDASNDPDGTVVSYQVFSSPTSGTGYSLAGTSSGTSFPVTGLAPGTKRYYRVKSVDDTGDVSANSSELAVTTTPAAPLGVTGSHGESTVTISWGAVTGAESYAVYRAADPGGPYTLIGSTASTSLSEYSCVKYTTNYYQVRAYNSTGGYSSFSAYADGSRLQYYSFVRSFGSPGSGDSQFNGVYDLAFDPTGTFIYACDTYNYKIKKFTADGTYTTSWDSIVSRRLVIGSSGMVFVAVCSGPSRGVAKYTSTGVSAGYWKTTEGAESIAVDSSGNIYTIDNILGRIWKFTPGGTLLTNCVAVSGGSGVTPVDIVVRDGDGIYFIDAYSGRLTRINFDFSPSITWQIGINANTFTFDAANNVYFAAGSSGDARVIKTDMNGRRLASWWRGVNGDGDMFNARGIAVDASGNVYVSDSARNKINVYAPEP